MDTNKLIEKIFNTTINNQQEIIEEVFQFQYQNNAVYQQWCNLRMKNNEQGMMNDKVEIQNSKFNAQYSIFNIPFLPISFFKSHSIKTTDFTEQQVFESSGTTQTTNSRHLIKDIEVYKQSFLQGFELVYGNIKDWCIIGLLPSYLERNNSSLVFMVEELVKQSNHPKSGFYLYEFDELHTTLKSLESLKQKTMVIGVTFALLDFAEAYPMQLQHTIIMETGGMKGRKKEITKEEVHSILKEKLNVEAIHSEYGMTELLSQAYATKDDKHVCPPWMKVVVRDEEDPFSIKPFGKGVINVIDLANIYSCSFIATDDVGEVFEDGSFKIFGRLDNSDLRGCSLMYL